MNSNSTDQFLSDARMDNFSGNMPMYGQPGLINAGLDMFASSNNQQNLSQQMTGEMSGIDFNGLDSVLFAQELKDFLNEEYNSQLEEVIEPVQDVNKSDPNSPYINQWRKIEKLMRNGSPVVRNQIDRIWTEANDALFNLSFRRHFAEVIEGMRWDLINPHDTGHTLTTLATSLAGRLYNEVHHALSEYDSQSGNMDQEFGYLLRKWYDRLGAPYFDPIPVARGIQDVLERERAIIGHSQNAEDDIPQLQNMKLEPDAHLSRISDLLTELSLLEKNYQGSAGIIEHLNSQVQELQLQISGQLRAIDRFNSREFSQQERVTFNGIVAKRNEVVQKIKDVLQTNHWTKQEKLQSVLSEVFDGEIREFQRNQAYINNGRILSHYCTLEQLQDWCKRLAMMINGNLQQMGKLQFIGQQLGLDVPAMQQTNESWQVINELTRKYSLMIDELVQKGLIVDKHPPQVLMKDKRFQSTLRHLVGDALDIHQVNFHVKTFLINAEQAATVIRDGPASSFRESGKIVNNEASSDFLTHTGVLSVNMRNMCLKMQQRGSQRAAEMVAELKFAMLYRAEIVVRYPSHQRTVVAQALSLPIVVISHGKQEADAQATIFWDNAFAKINRVPFEVDDTVSWIGMLEALDGRWKRDCEEGATGTGRAVGLSPVAKQYLTMKLFNHRDVSAAKSITWRKFNHDKMYSCGGPDQRRELFTFWTWFYKAMELCSSQHIKKFWNMRYIHGFLSKGDCQDLLMKASQGVNPGVFLFRFSETKLGAISISCTAVDERGRMQVRNLEPDVIRNFQVRSLPDMVSDLGYLTFLYPHIPKDEAFGSFYTRAVEPRETDSDYIAKEFKVATIEPSRHRSLADHGPDTPAAAMPISPHSVGYPAESEPHNSMEEEIEVSPK